jgi:hypothetical protein
MRKTVITLTIVGFLICANFIGIYIIGFDDNPSDISDELFQDESQSDSLGLSDEEKSASSNAMSDINEGDIDWSLLAQDKNPSAKLFLNKRIIAIEFELPELKIEDTEDGEIISLEDADSLLESGTPLVPEIRFFVAVPSHSVVKEVAIIEEQSRILEGNHILAPYIPNTLDGEAHFANADSDIYNSPELYPESLFEINGPDKLRHLDALEILLYPIRVRPSLGIVEVVDALRFTIELESKSQSKLTLPVIFKDDTLDIAILDTVVNSQDVIFSSSQKEPQISGTRAPSTIYHTTAYDIAASSIRTVKDTTVGNGGGASLLLSDDNVFYDSESGKTMYIDGFDIGDADSGATLEYATLHLQYKGTNAYDGSNYVRWSMEGDSLKDTTIQPTDLNNAQSADETYDLLGHVGSPQTVSDLVNLDIEFTENGVGAGSKDIPFDYVKIEFAFREELTGDSDYLIITLLSLADELQPLAEWKTDRLSIDTQVYDIDWIDSNWGGSDLKERIFDFIRSMFENYTIEWVLLCGDDTDIPKDDSHYDNYYANVVGYQYPDLSLGRLPSSNDYDMEGMVQDILVNQRDMGSWKNNMYLVGTNVFGVGDGKTHMLSIKDNYLVGHDFNFYEDYEVEGNNSNSRTINTYNMGMGASTYYGHGSSTRWTMNEGHSTLLRKSDVEDDFTNTNKRGFVWTLSCSTSSYLGSSVSIGEMWLISRNGGGTGYIGGAELVYVSPGMGLHRAFWRELDKMLELGEKPTQGEVHFRAQNSAYYKIYVLYGDPQVGLTLADPDFKAETGIFDSGNFVERKGFDQGDQITFKTAIDFPSYVLPRGVHMNLTIHNENGDRYYLPETFINDPTDVSEMIFWNWTVDSVATSGIYNITFRIYNQSQNWEFIYSNSTYFFVDYRANVIWVEQVNSEVIEGDTVTYKVHIDNHEDAIPQAKIWVDLKGRDYDPYMTPFDYYSSTTSFIPSQLDYIVEVHIPNIELGTFDVTAGMHIDWALMDMVSGEETEVRGVRILDVTYNHPIYFREDTVSIGYRYFAFSDFTGDASLLVVEQTDQLYVSNGFTNGTGWLNFTWSIPEFVPNETYNLDLVISGFSRSLEVRIDTLKVVTVREILDLGESWLIPRQNPDGGWEEWNFPWPSGSNYNETARVLQALIWSGVDKSSPVIQNAADYIENSLNLSQLGRVDDLSQTVWSLVEAGRGASQNVQDGAKVIRNMQNWIYEEEDWTMIFMGNRNDTWLVNVSGYDEGGSLFYSQEYNGFVDESWGYFWVNFSVLPGTVTLNVTINTSAGWVNAFIYPPFYKINPGWEWDGIWVDDFQGPGDGIKWNCSASEEFEFDRGWGRQKGMPSFAGFTAWGVIGLLKSQALGPFEYEAISTGISWLLDTQLPDGSWNPELWSGAMGGSDMYPQRIVGSWVADIIQNTAMPVIALEMNGTEGQPVDDAVAFLKSKQAENGSYPYNPSPWYFKINIISTAQTLRALRRAGYVFEWDTQYVREGVRWLCAAQDKTIGNWDSRDNFTRCSSEAILALASLLFARSIELEPGWNLISLSHIVEDTSLSSVLESIKGDYDAVQFYDNTDSRDPWKHYQIDKPSSLNDLSEINNDMGFLIHITNPAGATLEYIGSEPKRNQEIAIKEGWNLVGYPALCYRDRTQALNNLNFGSEVDAIWAYDATQQKWIELDVSDDIVPENGYLIHSKVNKNWIVPF